MLAPEYLAGLPGRLVELYAAVERDILADMARRIREYDFYIPAAQHQRQRLQAMGLTEEEVEARLSALTGKSREELQRLMEQAAERSLSADAAVYAAAGMGSVDPLAAAGVRLALRSGLEQTGGVFENLTRTTARAAGKQFADALDRAWLQIMSGGFDYRTAIRSAVKDLVRQGMASVTYPSGHTDTLEVAVRRAVVTGCNQTAAKAQLVLMDELGVELVEVTAHAGARPDHQRWQGGIYCRRGRTEKYENFEAATGYGTGPGLCGWNCAHSFGPYIEGAPRAYSPALLERYERQTVRYNGKELTLYEAGQEQRYIERQIRRWERERAAMEAAGLDTGEAAAKVSAWRAREREFCRQTGLKRQGERSQVGGAVKQFDAQYWKGFTMSANDGILSEKDIYALYQYKSSHVAYSLNSILRGEAPMTEEFRQIVRSIDQALLKLPTYQGTVYRSLRSAEMVDAKAFWQKYQPGRRIIEEAFTSSSTEIYDETMDIQMIIQSKRGCDMRDYNPLEKEVLFRRGSMFYVEKREGNTLWLIEI